MKKTLLELGINEKEIAVYLAILELGQANILEIAKKSGIPRATIYNIIENLFRHELINHILKGKRTFYYAEYPKKISLNLEEKRQKIKKVIPELQLLYAKATHQPIIKTFEGIEGIKKMLNDILITMPHNSFYDVILNAKDELPLLGQHYERFITKRIRRNIVIRVICEHSKLTQDWPQTAKEFLREVRFLSKGQHFSVSYHIYANKVALFSLQGPITGVIIENKEIANMERLQFEYMWKALK